MFSNVQNQSLRACPHLLLPTDQLLYFIAALVVALVVRAAMCALRTFERSNPPLHGLSIDDHLSCNFCRERGFAWNFVRDFGGYCHPDKAARDYWHPAILGFLELLAYPIFITNHRIAYIGAWLTLKTVAQWSEWAKNRGSFNRFLIGNALVIGGAFFLSQCLYFFDP